MLRGILVILILAVLALIAAVSLGWLDINQTREAKLPSLKVEAGQAPAFDVKAKEVVVGTTETNIAVPTVETRQKQVRVPVVAVKDAGEAAQNKQ